MQNPTASASWWPEERVMGIKPNRVRMGRVGFRWDGGGEGS